ncbi:MAG: hypothetical protein IJ766_03270, partial [Clostridia bacterium]|nr:hypothetical protein [Clostridia bacterium]
GRSSHDPVGTAIGRPLGYAQNQRMPNGHPYKIVRPFCVYKSNREAVPQSFIIHCSSFINF